MKKKNVLFILGILCLIVSIICIFAVFKEKNPEISNGSTKDYHNISENGVNYTYDSSIVSILFMGIDSTDSDTMGQADSLQLYLLNREEKSIQVLSLSRDAMTDIRLFDVEHNDLGWDTQHLGLAYAYGSSPKNGASLTSQAVSRMLNDIPIVHFAAMDLSELKEVQNVVGSLEVQVPNDSLTDIHPDWTKGSTALIDADNVEDFVRTRDIKEDFSNSERMERQKAYLNAYVTKIRAMLKSDFDNTVSKLYSVSQHMTTNISLEDIQTFAQMLLEYSYNEEEDFYTLPGKDQTGKNHDEFEIDKEQLNQLILELFYKRED